MTISTPCIKICEIDPVSGLCKGCLRNRDEIARWSQFTEPQRRAVMDQLPARRSLTPQKTTAPNGKKD